MIKDVYIHQVDQFCESCCTVTAQDIMQRAACPDKVASFKKYKRSPMRLMKAVAACIVFAVITAGVVFTAEPFIGFCFEPVTVQSAAPVRVVEYVKEVNEVNTEVLERFTEIFSRNYNDEKTVEIVEQGYVQEIGQVQENDMFSITLAGITGDQSAPKVVFDIVIKDEQIAQLNDSLYMQVYTLGVEQYKYELDSYGYYDLYAERDPEVANLYHGACNGAPVWLASGQEAMIAVKGVEINTPKENNVMQDIWFEYLVKPERSGMHPAPMIFYEDVTFEFENMVYRLNMAEYSYYRLCLNVHADYTGEDAPTNATEAGFMDEKLQAQWDRFARDLKVVADGEEYSVTNNGNIYIDYEAECGVKNRCYVYVDFPAFDYEAAQSIVLKAGDQSYELK